MAQGGVGVGGNAKAVRDLWSLLVDFQTNFPVIAPAG